MPLWHRRDIYFSSWQHWSGIDRLSWRKSCCSSVASIVAWWRHCMHLCVLLALYVRNPMVSDRFPSQMISNAKLWYFIIIIPHRLLNETLNWIAKRCGKMKFLNACNVKLTKHFANVKFRWSYWLHDVLPKMFVIFQPEYVLFLLTEQHNSIPTKIGQ